MQSNLWTRCTLRFVLALGLLLHHTQCRHSAPEFVATGTTMGTTWSARSMDRPIPPETVQSQLDSLEGIFSTWRADSEVSRFNAHRGAAPFLASPALCQAITFAQEIHRRSQGVFDPTVGALVAALGFGAPQMSSFSSKASLNEIRVDLPSRTLVKARPDLAIDLSALVEGYALDQIAANLEDSGHGNFLLEIGGEFLARGPGPRGDGWIVGIQHPGARKGLGFTSLLLQNEALATSGTYVQNARKDGVAVNHIIDPRTRKPVSHDTVSVTVIALRAIEADAWATALLVHGAEEGEALANQQGLEALFLKRGEQPQN